MNLEELKKIREKAQKDVELRQKQARIRIVVGMGTSGIAAGSARRSQNPSRRDWAKESYRRNRNPNRRKRVGFSGTTGRGLREGKPLVVYGNINQERAKRLVVEHVVNGNPVTEFALEVM